MTRQKMLSQDPPSQHCQSHGRVVKLSPSTISDLCQPTRHKHQPQVLLTLNSIAHKGSFLYISSTTNFILKIFVFFSFRLTGGTFSFICSLMLPYMFFTLGKFLQFQNKFNILQTAKTFLSKKYNFGHKYWDFDHIKLGSKSTGHRNWKR